MAIQGATQALIAAFAFGIIVNAATVGLILNAKGQGPVLRDGLRLVLITFFLSSALWAQIDFISSFIDAEATTSCQAAAVITTIFDQLARFSIEQSLLWAINAGTEASKGQMVAQGLLVLRFILGGVFVGLVRPQFKPVCVPMSSVLPMAVLTIALDTVIIATLTGRAVSVGIVRKARQDAQDSGRGKAIILVIAAFAIWTGTSVAMLLGSTDFGLVVRTTLPAAGLFILILAVAAASPSIVIPKSNRSARLPEAPSPGRINRSRDLSSSDSADYPPSQYEDLKREQVMSVTAFVRPREAPPPRNEGNSIMVTNGMPVTNALRINGMPVRGELFPPIKEMPAQEPRRVEIRPPNRQKRSGKISISNPVLLQSGGSNPLDRIPTVGLEEAARVDRERRAAIAMQRQSMTLIAQRAAPQPPDMSPEEAIKRSISTRRKDVAATTILTDRSTLAAPSSTTSAQLSPGGDEIRRRSPRQPPMPTQAMPIASRPRSSEQWQRVPTPPEQYADTARTICPSPQQLSSPPSPPPEPAKTPAQRRAATGLPSNPRARSARRLAKEAGDQRQQTVMFISNIVYDDPTLAQSVMNGPSEAEPKMPVPGAAALRASVVNRPRPIPRKPEMEAVRSNHRRSKSFNAIPSRKSILRSQAGSPTQLPPLPPPPRSAGHPGRPQPNDTKSMTFDEKMAMFFPAPPSTNRISPISEMPSVPASFWGNSPTGSDNDARSRRTRNSNRTTRTSARTENILDISEVDELPRRDAPGHLEDYRPPPRACEDLADDLDRYSFKTESIRAPISAAGKRASSPIIPPVRQSKTTVNTTARDDETTNWGSQHLPAAAHNIPVTLQKTRSTYIQRPEQSESINRVISGISNDDGELPVMLDPSIYTPETVTSRSPSSPDPHRAPQTQWHRRLGDELPSFSNRKTKTKTKTRRIPPTPLLLNGKMSAGKQAVLIQAAEPSPLESPEAALQAIQAQLKKYEEPNRDSVGSEGRQRIALLENLEMEMGQQESRWLRLQHDLARDSVSTLRTSPTVDSRPASINTAALPREPSGIPSAGERRNSRRARMLGGTAAISRNEEIQNLETSRASLWKQRLAETEGGFLDDMPDLTGGRSLGFLAVSKAGLGSPTPPDTDESDQEIDVHQSIAYVLLQAQFRPVPKSLWTAPTAAPALAAGHLWTPPAQAARVHVAHAELPGLPLRPLHRKGFPPLGIASKRLWQHPVGDVSHGLPGLWIPPYMRAQALARSSSQARQRAPPPKPLAQRPPRRSRRVTALPDILESPKPLPDKRGTLGIFQFPWGERSDTAAAVQPPPPPMFMPMPGTMTSGAGRAQQQQHEQAAAAALEGDDVGGYSSSFFDDYDDEDETLDGATASYEDYEMGSSSDDDDFDESTLWEIASLLKSNNVPSKLSMFPPARPEAVVDDYVVEIAFDNEGSMLGSADVEQAQGEEHHQHHPEPLAPTKSLWAAREEMKRGAHGKGLPQPDERAWRVYDSTKETARARPRRAREASVKSSTLWRPSTAQMASADTGTWSRKSALWVARKERPKGAHGKGLPQPDARLWALYDNTAVTIRTKPRRAGPAAVQSTSLWKQRAAKVGSAEPGLWSPKSALWVARKGWKKGTHGVGLPQPDARAWMGYDSIQKTLRARPRMAGPATIESESLWGQAVVKSLRPALWVAKKQARKGEHGKGLPHPDPQVWALYDSITETLRTRPRRAAAPTTIQSTALWGQTAAKPALWAAKKEAKKGEHGKGLPHPGEAAWARYDSVQVTARASPRRAQPVAIESQELWRPRPVQSAPASGLLWSRGAARPAGSSHIPRQGDAATPSTRVVLWTAPASRRADLRTTAAEPAALVMERRPRSTGGGGGGNDKPLARLASTSLWSAAARRQERHWLSATAAAIGNGPKASSRSRVPAPRPGPASRADWDAALREATAASYPAAQRPTAAALRRRAASPAEWAAALGQAVAASRPPRADACSPSSGGVDPAIVARIAALEEERLFAEQSARRAMLRLAAAAAPEEPQPPPLPALGGALWTKPAAGVEPPPEAMWRPHQAARPASATAPFPPTEAGPATPRRRRGPLSCAAGPAARLAGQGMWAGAEGRPQETDWLMEGVAQELVRVQLQYGV